MKRFINAINSGATSLGIELGSTRIKAVLIDDNSHIIAKGSFDWENSLVNDVWTYSLDEVWRGVQCCYKRLCDEIFQGCGVRLKTIGSIGVSAMMHGYLAFDKFDKQIAEFRTWRNTSTAVASSELTERLNFNIPQRWSIAHLYQAMLNNEAGVGEIGFLTTLAGYVHWMLTGVRVLGIGDASGVFPIDSNINNYDTEMIETFNNIIAQMDYNFNLEDILPKVLTAGEPAGCLTEIGANLLDPTGELNSGIPLCPPEGDAGTGMVATNSIKAKTGNVSAGTSVFAMIVLENKLSKVYEEIDMVTTPTGKPVAMVHCNNCSSDIDGWGRVFKELLEAMGVDCNSGKVLDCLFFSALKGDSDCGGVVSCNYFSGEPITGFSEGRPLVARLSDANFTLGNFARSLLYSAMATLKIGMDILADEKVQIESLLGHGGYFKATGVGQKVLSSALNSPISVMETAGEGGAWGIGVLAGYLRNKQENQTLECYLNEMVFENVKVETVTPNAEDVAGFNEYMVRYKGLLSAEKSAVESIR